MKKPVSIVLGSLLGAVAIHFTLAACSGGSSATGSAQPSGGSGSPGAMGGMLMDPTKDASAQQSACAQWQIFRASWDIQNLQNDKAFVAAGTIEEKAASAGSGATVATIWNVPAGWEPFAVSADGNGYVNPVFRRCAP